MGRTNRRSTAPAQPGKATKQQIIWYIAVYIRLSREDDNQSDSDSVINQKKILQEYLEQCFEGEFEIVDTYVDDGLTGTDDTRESFMRMVQDIEAGRVNCMLCKTLSRAFRNHSDQSYYLEEYFVQKNVRFISTGDPKVDTFINPDIIYGLEVPITGLMNDRYAARISADIRRTFNTKRRRGEFIGAFPPYGYLKDPENKNRLILDEEIVPVKRDIYNWLVRDGMSLRGIALKLNELGIPNPTAYKHSKGWNYNNPRSKQNDGMWAGSAIRRMMLDQMNLGHMVQGKQRVVSYKVHDRISVPKDEWFIVPNTHEATFTQEEYNTLVHLLQRDTRAANGERKIHLFSGFMRCYDCKKAMHRKTSSGRVYYFCRTYADKSKTSCTKHAIREDLIEATALAAIQAQVALLESLCGIVERINQAPKIDTQSRRIEKLLQEKHRELEKTRERCDGLYDDWKNGDITQDAHRRLKIRYEEKEEQLSAIITKLEEEQRQMGQGVDSDDEMFKAFLKHRNIRLLDRNVLVELVDTIHVHESKELTIDFRFADELERILEFVELNGQSVRAA